MIRTQNVGKTVPTINITDDLKCPLLWIGFCNVLLNPCHKMILEYTLDKLVEDVGSHEFMNVGTRKVMVNG
jgi:hypothetical protein